MLRNKRVDMSSNTFQDHYMQREKRQKKKNKEKKTRLKTK